MRNEYLTTFMAMRYTHIFVGVPIFLYRRPKGKLIPDVVYS